MNDYRPSTRCRCLQHTLSRPITALRLRKKTFQNRTCANHWKLLSKGENLRKFSWHTRNFLSKAAFESYFRKKTFQCVMTLKVKLILNYNVQLKVSLYKKLLLVSLRKPFRNITAQMVLVICAAQLAKCHAFGKLVKCPARCADWPNACNMPTFVNRSTPSL